MTADQQNKPGEEALASMDVTTGGIVGSVTVAAEPLLRHAPVVLHQTTDRKSNVMEFDQRTDGRGRIPDVNG
jgi:hypothetical protein